jgi:hypothetical protein
MSCTTFPTFFQETDDPASVAIPLTIPADLKPTVPGAAFPGLFSTSSLRSKTQFAVHCQGTHDVQNAVQRPEPAKEIQEMQQYEPGKKGYDPAKKKNEGYESAMKSFREWRQCCQPGQEIAAIEVDEINLKMFSDFSNFLCDLKKNSIEGKISSDKQSSKYSHGTILQYISGVYNVLKQNFPDLERWNQDLVASGTRGDTVPRWYRTIRDNVSRKVCNRIIEEGGKIQNKSEPIGRDLLRQMTVALLRKGDIDSVEMATNFVWDFVSCGRYDIFFHYFPF